MSKVWEPGGVEPRDQQLQRELVNPGRDSFLWDWVTGWNRKSDLNGIESVTSHRFTVSPRVVDFEDERPWKVTGNATEIETVFHFCRKKMDKGRNQKDFKKVVS